MSGDDDAALGELAGAILDGVPIDWDAVESNAAPAERVLVRRLRAIGEIVRAHRTDAPVTWGPLRLLERIGRGAFGDVYRAWDSRLDREVALKLLPVDTSSSSPRDTSIIEEGRLLARVRHPNVVTIYGAERITECVGLWMEYIDGRTLHQLVVTDRRRFSAREVAAIGCTLCSAVAAVHAAGLLHHDIKAQNVMMARDGRVVLMDFGSGRDRSRTSAADLAGTPLYIAPEVLTGTGSPSIRSDIYSVGVLLFFLLTGSYPVTGADLAALRDAHARGERRSLTALSPTTPPHLLRAVERAIEPRPEGRYESAEALGADLAGPEVPSHEARRSEERRRDDTGLDTYEMCVRGHTLLDRRGMPNAQLAAELFERAIARDPGFAPAYAGLATAYVFWSFPYRGISFDRAYPVMRPAAVKALELDPLLATAHSAMAWVYTYERDWVKAEEAFKEALRLDPTVGQTYTSYSLALQPHQRYDDALRLLHVALQQDPSSLNVQREIGEVQLLAGRYSEAVEILRRVAEVEPDFPFVQTFLANAEMYKGNVTEAIARLDQGFPWLAQAYVMSGKRAEAEKLAEEWKDYPFRLAIIAAALGDADRAARAVERAAVKEHHRIGWLLVQPQLAPVRDHPRVVAIRKAFNLP